VELVAENLGQPGFRELLVTVHDMDTRRDLIFALLAQNHRADSSPGRVENRRRARQAFDLSG
jgi:hypothetical protein